MKTPEGEVGVGVGRQKGIRKYNSSGLKDIMKGSWDLEKSYFYMQYFFFGGGEVRQRVLLLKILYMISI